MDFFSVDFSILRRQLLPVRLRADKFQAWLRVLTHPVQWLYEVFMASRHANKYYLAHNGQICHMEAVLNDRFDNVLQRIAIRNGPFFDPIYLFLDYEDWPVYLATDAELTTSTPAYEAPSYLFTHTEIYDTGVLFQIYCIGWETSFSADEQKEMRGLIEHYRLPSKKGYVVIDALAPPLDL